jgi:hypothetical protein
MPKNANVLARFEQAFDKLVAVKKYGIKLRTTCAEYLADFMRINTSANGVKYYVYDLPLKGWKQGVPKSSLWDSFESITAPLYVDKGGKEIAPKEVKIPM